MIECEDCGYEIPMLKSEVSDLPDAIICSRCQAAAWWTWRQKKNRENHTPRLLDEMGDPIEIPPVVHINTCDLPGFVADPLAKKIGQTLDLFKK